MSRIHFLRHAESAANAGLRTPANAEIPLTETGKKQAQDFADSMQTPPSLILVSPFRRALDTAAPIRRKFNTVPYAVRDLLHEMVNLSPRIFDGTTAAERAAHVRRYWAACDPDYRDGDDAESFTGFMNRVKAELSHLATLDQEGILVVSHGQFINMARLLVTRPNVSPTELMPEFFAFWRANPIPNTGSVMLDI